MARKWGASGIPKLPHADLKPATKQQILEVLRAKGVDVADMDGFLAALDGAAALYYDVKEVHENSLPSVVRRRLTRLRDAAKEMIEAINDLDGNSAQLLNEIVPGGSGVLQADALPVLQASEKALFLAGQYVIGSEQPRQKQGKPAQDYRLFTAVEVAHAVEVFCRERPKVTKNGLFSNILSIVLEDVTGKEVKAVHDLAARALTPGIRRVSSDGIVTFVPPDRDFPKK